MTAQKTNFYKLCLQAVLYASALIFATGAAVQTFLLLIGFTEEQVYLYSSLTQFAQITVMTVMVFFSGRIKRHSLYSAIAEIAIILPMIVFLVGAIDPSVFSNTYMIIVFMLSIVAYGAVGFHSVVQYCLPYGYLDMADYGKLTGISTALAGGFGFILSTAHSIAVKHFGYVSSMRAFFIIGIVLFVASAAVLFTLKKLSSEGRTDDRTVGKGDLVAVFRNPDTYYLLVPNFCRGLSLGIMNVIAIIAITTNTLTADETSYINIILQLASFAANIVFALLYKRLGVGKMLLFASALTSLFLPFALGGGATVFIILFFASVFFRYIVDSAIPTTIAAIIPEDQIGAYTAIRMLVFTGAQAIVALLIPPIASLVGYTGLLAFAASMQLVCGIGHYAVIVFRHSSNPLLNRNCNKKSKM